MSLTKTKKQPKFSKKSLLRSICRESFADFVKEHWHVVIPSKPVWNWHIPFICDELQKIAERVFVGKPNDYDLIINVPPGSTKSTIASIMYPAWCWTRMPSCRMIGASYAYQLAMALARGCRDIVKSDLYQELFPEVQIRPDQDSKGYFMNTLYGDRFSTSTGGNVVGLHGHLIIVDDPLDPQQAGSELELATANQWLAETLSTRKIDKTVTCTILIQQRLAQDDPTGTRLEMIDNPVKHICLPAEWTEDVNPPELKVKYDLQGGLLDPIRLPKATLEKERVRLGEFAFACQFMQTPIPRGGGMFKVSQLKTGVPPGVYKNICRYWDNAGTQGGGAYSVGAKLALDFQGRYWVLDIVRGQWDSTRREDQKKMAAIRDGIQCLIGQEQEPGSGGKDSAEQTVRNLAGYRVFLEKVGQNEGNKELRADSFSSQVNAGNVYMYQADWNKAFINELKYFPKSKYKDIVDACSGAFNKLAKGTIVVGGIDCLNPKKDTTAQSDDYLTVVRNMV